MNYPKAWKKVTTIFATIAGVFALIIALLSVMEAILRHFFDAPTSWSLNVCCYLLIWVLFLGSPYAFQEHGHVGVDLFKDVVDKLTKRGRLPRRLMAIVGYLLTLVFLAVILYGSFGMVEKAIKFNIMTTATDPIPIIYLYAALVIGTVLMIVTVIFIVLDLLKKGNNDYL